MTIINYFEWFGIILLAIMGLVIIRVALGPTVIDRLLGVNVIGTKSIMLLLIIGVIFQRLDMFVDIAIGYGLLNYIASIAAARYFQHRKDLHPPQKWKGDEMQV
ncbi:MAG: pH regulation protein F [Actinobacteria bacterium]|nr:pH regulation protein F [Actinomycetota bacterium]|tara:strand:+ start:53 stop:364 length:312 start_codon:yes stop_codon:yes gene_type:complete